MIEVHFFDYGCGILNVEKILGITEDVDIFLIKKIPNLQLEAADNKNDLEDNVIYWFSAENEINCINKIHNIIEAYISKYTQMQYTVRIVSDLFQ